MKHIWANELNYLQFNKFPTYQINQILSDIRYSALYEILVKTIMIAKLDACQKSMPSIPYIYAAIGNVFLVFMQISMKIVTRTITPFSALYIRGFLLLALNTLVLRSNNIQVSQPDKFIHSTLIKRSIFSTIALSCFLSSIAFLPIGIASALFNVGPLLIFILQTIHYKKGFHFIHFGLTVVCFIGILLIIKPDFLFGKSVYPFDHYLLFLPLIGALGHAFAMLYLHQLKGKTSNLVVLQYFYMAQTFATGFLQNLQQMHLLREIDYTFFLAIAGLVGCAYINQNCQTRATLLKKASYIMPFGYISIVLACISDILIFDAHFDWLAILGIVLTSCGLLSKFLIQEK